MNRGEFWEGKSVFLTGHTGFKGTWLTHLLVKMGARVSGYALDPQTAPSMFNLTEVKTKLVNHFVADIRDAEALKRAVADSAPELVIHMAAQPFVRRSYKDPTETWSSNVMGTVNCLEAVRSCASVAAVLVVTTDKCYENHGWDWGYRENDILGGQDPYSASKAATELVVQSYRKSFFKNGPLLASARAGNVIGGGDWSEDRLIPDIVRAVTEGKKIAIRNPQATRPWQHALDCLDGYLKLSEQLLQNHVDCATSYNFGPEVNSNVTVQEVLGIMSRHWNNVQWELEPITEGALHEAAFLYLDSAKARNRLAWHPRWSLDEALQATADWYRLVISNPEYASAITLQQIEKYVKG